jgi:ACR3 family arsenite efflux pump ArsB
LSKSVARSECSACRQREHEGTGYRLQTSHGPVTRCLWCAVRYRPLLRRSTLIALVVGSVLVAINQGDAIVAGHWDMALIWKVPLTYLVPFVVATWGALINSRVR